MFPYLPKPVATIAAVLTPLLLASAVSAAHGDCGKCLAPSVTKEATSASHRDYLVTVGKRAVWTLQAMQSVAPPLAQAASASFPSRDYLVTQGKRTVLASTVVAPAPVVSASQPSCMMHRFLTEGKATRWEIGCAMQGTERQMGCCIGQ